MDLWRRLVGTPADPRRVANPGLAFAAFALAVAYACMGVLALLDDRQGDGLFRLAFAVFWSFFGHRLRADRRRRLTSDPSSSG